MATLEQRLAVLERKARFIPDTRPFEVQYEESRRELDAWYEDFERTELAAYGGNADAWIDATKAMAEEKLRVKMAGG